MATKGHREILDDADIREFDVDLHYRNGFTFSLVIRIAAVIAFLFALWIFSTGEIGFWFLSAALIPISLYLLTSTYGVQISFSNKYVRPYTASFGIKRGKWVSTIVYPDISILKTGSPIDLKSNPESFDVTEEKANLDIFLLSKNHRKRIFLYATKSGNDAFLKAYEIADKLEKNFVPFHPVISKATLARRYERH